MTGKQTQGAVAYDGTGALKMAAPEAPAQKKKFRKKETKGKKETKETQHPVVKNGAALLTKGARWTVPGAILAILTVALVVVITLASYAQLVVVNDKVVELRNELSELQSEETQLKAQYELAYDLSAIEEAVTSDGSMVKPQASQIYTLDLSEEDSVVRYDQESAAAGVAGSFLDTALDFVDGLLSYFH